MPDELKRVLILCKTYPTPSSKYAETSCVAGMEESGKLIRIFPVPFRLIENAAQFKKWQWTKARMRKALDDHRPESHRIYVDTIELEGEPLSTAHDWLSRRQAINGVRVFDDFDALEQTRQTKGITLGLVRPSKLLSLDITPTSHPEWTPAELANLMKEQNQGHLFEAAAEEKSLRLLKKLPFDFHYRYECQTSSGIKNFKHKINDWEAGAYYWNVQKKPNWQAMMRERWVSEFAKRDVLFLMGTMHRFPDQWLIVSVIYPPKPLAERAGQTVLF
jgi:hypothetical protein